MANKKIQGLTIEIGGDTTKLSNALKEPNKEANSLQQKLRAVEQALKVDPTNVELIEQKFRLLGQAIETNENKLKLLKTAQDQFKASGKDIDSSEYIELQRQIALTTKKINDLKSEKVNIDINSNANTVKGDVDSLKNSIDNTKDSANDLKNSFVGAFAADQLAEAGSTVKDTITGIIDESKEYIKIIGALETSSTAAGYSAEQTAEVYKLLFGVLGDDQTAATTTANLQALKLEQEQLIQITNGVIGAWAKYGDSIPIDGLAESVNETIKTATVTGNFADVLNWAGTSEDEFNKKLEKANTESERANIVLQELSNQGLIQSADAFRNNNQALIESNEAQSEYQDSLAELAEILMPIVTDITEAITFLIDGFNNLPGSIQTVVIVVLGFITVLATLSPIIFSVSTLFTALGGTALFANASMLPIVATILAIIAAVTAVILIFQNWDSIIKWFSSNFSAFKNWIGSTVNSISEWFGNMGANIKGAFLDLWDQIYGFFSNLFESAVEWGSDMIDGFVKGIKKAVGKVTDAVKGVADTITSWLHFSRPDIGPLREYEKWMPDFMSGLAKGIRDNKWKVEDELALLSNDMSYTINANVNKSLEYNNTIETVIPLELNVSGKTIYNDVIKRITRNQSGYMAFRGN